jgi:hypothetical protein
MGSWAPLDLKPTSLKFAAPEHSRIDVAVVETSARALLTWLLLTFGRTPSALTQAEQEPWKACYTLVEF